MNWLAYLPLVVLAVLILSSAVYAFFWATKHGEFRDLDGQARSIFDAAEPEGVQTDFFPGKAPDRTNLSASTPPASAVRSHS